MPRNVVVRILVIALEFASLVSAGRDKTAHTPLGKICRVGARLFWLLGDRAICTPSANFHPSLGLGSSKDIVAVVGRLLVTLHPGRSTNRCVLLLLVGRHRGHLQPPDQRFPTEAHHYLRTHKRKGSRISLLEAPWFGVIAVVVHGISESLYPLLNVTSRTVTQAQVGNSSIVISR